MRVINAPEGLPASVRRVSVIGTSGCGKSFFGRELSARTGAVHLELDGLHWRDDWTEATEEEFRAGLDAAMAGVRWIVDGNYASRGARDAIFAAADLVVWLDLPLRTVLGRVTVRSVRRAATKEPLWGTNNHESFRFLLASRHSMPLWVVRTFHSRRRRYGELAGSGAFAGTALVRIRSAGETMRWLEAIARVMGEG